MKIDRWRLDPIQPPPNWGNSGMPPAEEAKAMTEHEGLPVAGYKTQSSENVAKVNEFKRDEELLLRKLDAMESATTVVPADDEEGGVIYSRAYSARWLEVARRHFEQGFMALNRSVFQPGRVKLDADDVRFDPAYDDASSEN